MLRDYNIVYPNDKIMKILLYLDLLPSKFTLKSFIYNLDSRILLILETKITLNDVTNEDINNAKVKIKNILFASGKSPEDLYNNFAKDNFINFEKFNEMINIYSKDPILTEFLIKSIFLNITQSDKKLSLEDFKNEFL